MTESQYREFLQLVGACVDHYTIDALPADFFEDDEPIADPDLIVVEWLN